MWTKLNHPLDPRLVVALRDHFSSLDGVFEDRHFVRGGKKFFKKQRGFDYLRSILRHIEKELPLSKKWRLPAIHHAYPLYKSAGGPATTPHQDRPYWTTVENEVSMMTFWIALDDIDKQMGCLRLNRSQFVRLSDFKSMNAAAEIHPHIKEGNDLAQHITKDVAARLAEKMEPISVKKGEIILFDAFQVHASEQNSTDQTRRAMKVVLGDAKTMTDHLIVLDDLDKDRKFRSLFINPFFRTLRFK